MSAIKHTPGPFEVQNPMGDDIGLWIVQAGLEAYEWSCIAIVCRDDDRSGKHFITKAEQKANADLFAAATEMLAALKHIDDIWDGEPEDMQPVRAAIAKAEGRS